MVFIILLVCLFIVLGILELKQHQSNAASIPVRIHVNGTRGKSSVTRLIAGALREGGLRTVAKTTGSAPQVILEDGHEIPIVRPRGANIIEQLRVFSFVAPRKPQAIVIECMAVQPEYQWICEHRIVTSTIGVITNARPDHLREMGPTVQNVARSLCNTLPIGRVAFTCEKKLFNLMDSVAKEKQTKLNQVTDEGVSDEDMMGFHHVEHKENVALALAVSGSLGVPRETALRGMYRSEPDCGALKLFRVTEGERQMTFVNALAANDPESTLAIWETIRSRQPEESVSIFVLNTRQDRFERSVQLVEMVHADTVYERLVLIGQCCDRMMGVCYKLGLPADKVINLGNHTPEQIYKVIAGMPWADMTVLGIGNVHGGGHEVAHYFEERSRA
ncbi:MAG: poly-gamma-glutamate synthase PgsB [Calditrichaeota bacterium]|nr:poly-gamma-glutamate synthase PgsB [Candidatus Cloacimonadota bacterium]MCB1047493.1 poly-gamma-glutamate synthase PgsB [Calditrichota bacterium]MCB9473521.1 poly-gamma-glutamate synthase PgsB [Candidatus Delongbacteria bacterium]